MNSKSISSSTGKQILFCLSVFSFVFLWLFFQMNRGIFFADVGYHIYEAQQAFQHFGRPCVQFWLTSYLSGAWLFICPSENIFYWNALGGCIVGALTYVAAGLLILEIFPISRKHLLIILAISALFQVYPTYDFAVNYYNLPFLVALFAIFLYLKSRNSSKTCLRVIYLVSSSALFALLPSLRIATICFILTPIVYELVMSLFNKVIDWKNICTYTMSLFICLCGTYLLYQMWHRSIPEFELCGAPTLKGHSIDAILLLTLKQIILYCRFSIPITGIFLVLRYFSKTKYRWEWLILIPVIAYTLYFGWYFYCSGSVFSYPRMFANYRKFQLILPFVLLTLLLLPIFRKHNHAEEKRFFSHSEMELRVTLLMLTVFGIIYPFGSDCFIYKALYSIPLLLPILLVLMREHIDCSLSLYRTCLTSLALIGVVSYPCNADIHVKSDYNRLHMNVPYQSKALSGMLETQVKVEATEKMIHVIQQYTKPQDEILFNSLAYELLPGAEVRSWMHPPYHVPAVKDSDFLVYSQNKPLPKIAVDFKGDESWASELQSLHYQKVYSTKIMLDPQEEDSEFSVWIRENE